MPTKTCKISGKEFTITDEDLVFYKKMGVPEPTLCPEERQRRRLAFRNDNVFYKRKCDFSGKDIISTYSQNSPFVVYHQSEWLSDKWDPMDYGMIFDFNTSFFAQFQKLMLTVPRMGMVMINCENSDYCNYCGDDKNCYLDIAGEGNEDCYYNLFTKFSKNTTDCTFVYNGELNYESISCYKSFNLQYCINLKNCSNCLFSIDLQGCSDCFLCSNLRNAKYYINNIQYSKTEYFQKLGELQLQSYNFIQIMKQQWYKILVSSKHKYAQILNSVHAQGDNITDSRNVFGSFNVSHCEDSSYLYDVLNATNCRDLNYSLYDPEMSLELISTLSLKFSGFSLESQYCKNIFYCSGCNGCSDCFGCIGLTNKQYCIFNTQYEKEEYLKLKNKIIEHMSSPLLSKEGLEVVGNKEGVEVVEWGEFFPIELSPFGYNETVANDYFPLTEKEILQKGYAYKQEEESVKYSGEKYIIPDNIQDVEDEVLKNILECECCSKNYKIVGPELVFYRKQNLPIPRNCPKCRHLERMKLRNPRKLFDRNCNSCKIEIQSTFSSDREEKIYCEKCYEEEVY